MDGKNNTPPEKTNSILDFVQEVLSRSCTDVNTKDAERIVRVIAKQLQYQNERDLFNMPEAKAKYITEQIEFLTDVLSQYISLLQYTIVLKKETAKLETCISGMYHDMQIKDIDLFIARDYLHTFIEQPGKRFTIPANQLREKRA